MKTCDKTQLGAVLGRTFTYEVLQAVAPLYILVLGPWALGERWTSRDLAHVGALVTGLAFCFFAPGFGAPSRLGVTRVGEAGFEVARVVLVCAARTSGSA